MDLFSRIPRRMIHRPRPHKPRRIRVVVNALGCRTGGGLTYLRRLLPALVLLEDSWSYTILVRPGMAQALCLLPSPRLQVIEVPRKTLFSRVLWEQTELPCYIRKQRYDLLFNALSFGPFSYTIPAVLTAHTSGAVRKLPGCPPVLRRHWTMSLLRFRLSVRVCSRIIAVSEHLRQEVIRDAGLSPHKVVTVHHGLSSLFAPRDKRQAHPVLERFGIHRPFILTVSDINFHKNFPNLVRAFGRLSARTGKSHDLVIAGRSVDAFVLNQVQDIVAAEGISDNVHLLGSVEPDDLVWLYSAADLFVFPSLHETFGMPLTEAMACGLPVAAARTSCLPEICQQAALYFDPYDIDDMADTLFRVLTDDDIRRMLVQHGRLRAAQFSWERCARDTFTVFQQVVGSSLGRGKSLQVPDPWPRPPAHNSPRHVCNT